jgi:hypothetical protein
MKGRPSLGISTIHAVGANFDQQTPDPSFKLSVSGRRSEEAEWRRTIHENAFFFWLDHEVGKQD